MDSYPKPKKEDVMEEHFGIPVHDPYRWMENESDEDLPVWLEAQTRFTRSYFSQIPHRDQIRTRLRELYNYPKYSTLLVVGNRIIYGYNDGLQNQYVYYIQEGLDGEPQVLIDPNGLSEDGTISITLNGHSKDKRYLAFLEAQSGSDWQVLKTIDLLDNQVLQDQLQWVKFTWASWYQDGFFYSAYEQPEPGKELSAKNENMKVYYHRLGEKQTQDRLIFSDDQHPLRFHEIRVSENEQYLILISSQGTYGNEIRIKRADEPEEPFRMVFKGFDHEYHYMDSSGDELYFLTDQDASNKKIVSVNGRSFHVQDRIPETDDSLVNAWKIGSKLITLYLKDVVSKAFIFDTLGNLEHEVQMPGVGSAYQFEGDKEMNRVFFSFGSFITPLSLYSVDLSTGETAPFKESHVPFDTSPFVTEQVFCESKDGTKVPVFITRKKDCVLDGSNPTLLYAYGGFNISLTPGFNPAVVYLLERGGIYAQANLRGGSEYGEAWHKDGMLLKKQNVFDDFIAVAESLIKKGYTSHKRLGIQGGSNGGLLMGAVTNQRPDLFNTVFAQVGVMDMLRYHKFTIGWGWACEYGNPEEEEHFKNILTYSPLHNIEEKDYPSILVMTADHDDRVVPVHSYKYLATLQEKNTSNRPILLRLDQKTGHGMGKPIEKIIEEKVDHFAFFFHQLSD